MIEVNVLLALSAGTAAFLSPCCLPLYPSYLSYITGISLNELKGEDRNVKSIVHTMSHTFVFIVGFSLVYYTLGYGVNTFADFFSDHQRVIRQISALSIMLMGMLLTGMLKPLFLLRDFKLPFRRGSGYLGSFIFGIGFSAGWSPCTGPILTAILALAAASPGTWFQLTTAYAAGFAIPFFILAFFIGSARWLAKYSSLLMKVGGVVMIMIGVLLFTDRLTLITLWLNSLTPSWMQV